MAILGGAAALGELGLGISSAVSGPSATNVPLPSPIPNVGGAANQAYSNIGNLGAYNLYGPNIGQYQSTSQQLFNNPYAPQYQGGAGTAGNMATGAGTSAFAAGGGLYGYGNELLGTAFDPQSALYNRTVQQLQDQTRAANAAAGVATSPYGAGIEANTLSNFNIDWQNQQLDRQLRGVQGGTQAFQGAAGLQQQAPIDYLYGSALPYGTFNTIGSNQLGTLQGQGQFGAAGAMQAQQPIADYLSYMTGGQNSNLGLGQLGLNQSQLGWQQTAGAGQAIGAGIGGLSGMGWGNNPFNTPLTNPNMTWF